MFHPNRRKFLVSGTAAAAAAALSTRLTAADRPSTNQRRIKLGQLGVGHAHASKLASYRASPDYEVVGIVEPDPMLRQRAESQAVFQGLPWMTLDQLLNVADLEVVLVETRVRDSLEAAEKCIAAGKHIHLDKPAGESFSHFRRIMQLAATKKLLVQLGYMYRYNPGVLLMRDLLKRGWLGEPFEVHTVMSKVVGAEDRRRLAEYPGGIMFELGCHIIDLVVGVLQRPDRVESHSRRIDESDGLVDNMLAVLEYPKALATVKSSALEVEGFARRHFVLCGTEGTIHIEPLDDPSVRLALSQSRDKYTKGYQVVSLPKFERYTADAADMAKVIREEKESDFPYEHDLAVQETILRACKLPLD